MLKVPLTIPAKLTELGAFAAANGWTTACEALADIRHGYVHSNKKRRQIVLSAPNLATFQAWQLSLWYQELALLYLLGHKGDYRNRLTAEWLGEVETAPWAQDTTRFPFRHERRFLGRAAARWAAAERILQRRHGDVEREQYLSILAPLPEDMRLVVPLADVTGCGSRARFCPFSGGRPRESSLPRSIPPDRTP